MNGTAQVARGADPWPARATSTGPCSRTVLQVIEEAPGLMEPFEALAAELSEALTDRPGSPSSIAGPARCSWVERTVDARTCGRGSASASRGTDQAHAARDLDRGGRLDSGAGWPHPAPCLDRGGPALRPGPPRPRPSGGGGGGGVDHGGAEARISSLTSARRAHAAGQAANPPLSGHPRRAGVRARDAHQSSGRPALPVCRRPAASRGPPERGNQRPHERVRANGRERLDEEHQGGALHASGAPSRPPSAYAPARAPIDDLDA